MKPESVSDYLRHIRQAADDAISFVAGMEERGFSGDLKTQRAAVMSLIIVGEAAARLMDKFPDFAASHSEIPWNAMRGMRNRMTHGYSKSTQG